MNEINETLTDEALLAKLEMLFVNLRTSATKAEMVAIEDDIEEISNEIDRRTDKDE